MNTTIHVLPLHDRYFHRESFDCECCPREDEQFPDLIIHNAYDERELKERIQELQSND